MTVAEQLTQILDASTVRTCTETHDRNQTPALAYARALWALEADLRALAATIEGAHQ
ncbi:hypothetical protein [Rhodococcus sp. SGAir0479]|uniref:hypothetical protein n=1 Tax=Rhodococcus sp. SGAir0479 TaxID=2567884 RepID=UPI001586B3B0|nr:hypothetical protein [Rhodococcus sp. SGAir0479]